MLKTRLFYFDGRFHLPQRQISLQKQPPEVFRKKGVLSNFAKFKGKHLYQSPCLNKVAGSSFWKERLWHRYYHVNFVKFLRTPFLQNTSGRLRLSVWEDRTFHRKVPFSLGFISLKNILQWVRPRKKDVDCFLCSVVCILNPER